MSHSAPPQAPQKPNMGSINTATIVLDVIATTWAVYLIHVWYTWRRLSHVPGPFWDVFTKLWMVSQSFQRRQPYAFVEANNKFGSLVRVGPNEVITDDPNVLRKIMALRSTYTRGYCASICFTENLAGTNIDLVYHAMRFNPTRDNLLSMRNEAAHTKLSEKMAAGYSGKENESMEDSVDAHFAKFVELIETKYLSTPPAHRPLDVGEKASSFTLDVISNLVFGQAFGYLKTDQDVHGHLAMTKTPSPLMMAISDVPMIADILQSRLFRAMLASEADKVGFGAFIGIAKRLLAERYSPNAESRFDMLGSFIHHGLTEEAAGEALLQIVTGSDTSAGTIRAVMLNVLTNPYVYKTLQSTIDASIKAGNVSSPITDAEARNMPYLQAVIKEGLRILPPASGAMLKQVPPRGDIVGGKYLPGGT